MSLPTIEPLPDEDETLSPAQRRLRRRVITPPRGEKRAGFMRDLSMRAAPSFDFYLFSLLAGLVLAAGLLLDAQALFVLSALVAPFLAPLIGAALGAISGQGRFTTQSLVSLLIGSVIVLLCGLLAGWATNLLPPREYFQAMQHARLSWPDLVVLALGAGLASYGFVRQPNQKPLVASVAMAYTLYLPAGVAGFGLSSGIAGLWPDGLWLFFVHLLLALGLGALGLAFAGLRPWNAGGAILTGTIALAAIVLLAAAAGTPRLSPQTQSPAALISFPTSTPLPKPTGQQTPTITTSPTRPPNTQTPTPTRTLIPTGTPTETITPVPTPVWARIQASAGGGALIREKPDYNAPVLQSLLNGTLVEVLPEVETTGNVAWVHIRLVDGREGWIVRSLLRTATPAASW